MYSLMKDEFHKLAYCAGYLDGDGCFYLGTTIQKPKNILVYEYSIQVLSVKKEILYEFVRLFGGFVREKPQRIRHKTPFCWTIKGQNSVALAKLIYPFLTDKKITCAIYIEFSETIVSNNWKIVGEEIIKKRNEFIIKIRKERHMNDLITKQKIEAAKLIEKTIEPSRLDYAYFAGLIDSEGCFRVKKWKPKHKPNSVYAIHIEIGNTKFAIISWLVERFGGHIAYIPEKPRKKAVAIWSLSANALYKILPKIHPFLSTKKEICEKLMEFQATILPNGGDRHSELFHGLFEKTRMRREAIIDEIHKLNLKGSS